MPAEPPVFDFPESHPLFLFFRNSVIIELMLNPKTKLKIVSKHSKHEGDTGSAEVQIALFTEEIEALSKHLKKHQKDNSSRTGLLKMVSKRKRLLDYLKKESPTRHAKLAKELGLKK